jgi:hypothetical protein
MTPGLYSAQAATRAESAGTVGTSGQPAHRHAIRGGQTANEGHHRSDPDVTVDRPQGPPPHMESHERTSGSRQMSALCSLTMTEVVNRRIERAMSAELLPDFEMEP